MSLGYDEYTWPGHSHGRRLHEGDEDKHADEPDYPGYLDLRNYTNGEEIEVRGEAELALTMPLRNYRVADPYNATEWKYSRSSRPLQHACPGWCPDHTQIFITVTHHNTHSPGRSEYIELADRV